MTRALRLPRVSCYLTIDDELISIFVPHRHEGLIEVAEAAILKLHIHRLRLPVIELTHYHYIYRVL